MHTAQFKICENCHDLRQLYEELSCSVLQFSKNKWTNQTFNTSLHYDHEHFRDLLRIKRIVEKRLFNADYCRKFSSQDVIGLIVRNLYKGKSCQPCPCKDFEGFLNTSTTSTTSTSSTTQFIPPIPPTSTTTIPEETTTTILP